VSDEHALITYLPLSGEKFGTGEEREAVFAPESRIEEAVAKLGGEPTVTRSAKDRRSSTPMDLTPMHFLLLFALRSRTSLSERARTQSSGTAAPMTSMLVASA
jgi:hypothetical protein